MQLNNPLSRLKIVTPESDEVQYEVEKILDHRKKNGLLEDFADMENWKHPNIHCNRQ